MLMCCTDVAVYYILCKYVEKKLIFYMMHVLKAVVDHLRFSNVVLEAHWLIMYSDFLSPEDVLCVCVAGSAGCLIQPDLLLTNL